MDHPGWWCCFFRCIAWGIGFFTEMNCVSRDRSPGEVDPASRKYFHGGRVIIMKCGGKMKQTFIYIYRAYQREYDEYTRYETPDWIQPIIEEEYTLKMFWTEREPAAFGCGRLWQKSNINQISNIFLFIFCIYYPSIGFVPNGFHQPWASNPINVINNIYQVPLSKSSDRFLC